MGNHTIVVKKKNEKTKEKKEERERESERKMNLPTRLIPIVLILSSIFRSSNGFVARRGACQSYGNRRSLLQQQRRSRGPVLFLQEQSTTTMEQKIVPKSKEVSETDKNKVPEEEMTETQKLMAQVKEAGLAGVISYALWEFGFWTLSVPVCIFGYYGVTGHWPDFTNAEDQGKLGAEAFAFVNFARFAVPLRIGLALGTTPWIDENVVQRFLKKKEQDNY